VPELDESESRVERINVAGQDVTEQKMIEGELTRQRDRAEQMSRLKDTFLANMSHEIRTPLASIIGAADILHSEVASEAHDLVSFIRRGGERLMETLSSVLDLAQLQGRSIELHPETFDLVSEIGRVLDLFRPRASSKGLALELVSRTSKSIYVSTDRVALGRVIANLLSNAVKFTHQGGVTVRIGVANRRIDIDVMDTGVGIPPEFLPDIYEEFSQASVGHTRSHEGAGLGLAITRRLVGLLGGTIDVIASSNEGTTFRVSLPHTTAGPRGLLDHLDDPALPARDMQILVVDDDPTVGEIVRRYLETNAVVHVADGRAEAAEFAAERLCDLVLMDINLKRGQRGDEVMHSMRMIKGYDTVPFIALTAYALPGDRERFLASGFDGYVSKPFRKDHLIRTINSVLK
jgi:CheY-like chemotaxis protein